MATLTVYGRADPEGEMSGSFTCYSEEAGLTDKASVSVHITNGQFAIVHCILWTTTTLYACMILIQMCAYVILCPKLLTLHPCALRARLPTVP